MNECELPKTIDLQIKYITFLLHFKEVAYIIYRHSCALKGSNPLKSQARSSLPQGSTAAAKQTIGR